MSLPLVSIVCITYNHAGFIRQCLDGFIMQKTDFPFEVLIHDDASNDGTTEIVREYAEKYPEIFVPFYEKENQFGKTDFCRDILFPKIRGKFVAICEGDDFWTDELKLQKQIRVLEEYPNCAVCFHPVNVHWDSEVISDSIFPDKNKFFHQKILTINDLLTENFIATCSVMYRWRFHHDDLSIIPSNLIPGDWYLHLLHAQVGDIYFINNIMSVYRKHKNGLWFGAESSEKWFKRCGISYIRFYKEAEKQFKYNFHAKIKSIAMQSCIIAEKNNDYKWIKNIYETSGVSPENLLLLYSKLLILKILTPFVREKKRRRDIQTLKKSIKNCINIKKCIGKG